MFGLVLKMHPSVPVPVFLYHNQRKKGNPGSCGIRTQFPEETPAQNERLRPLAHPNRHKVISDKYL